jgi:signal transduction histidine kinase
MDFPAIARAGYAGDLPPTVRPADRNPPALRLLRTYTPSQLLRYAGLFTWACVGLSLAFVLRPPSGGIAGNGAWIVFAWAIFAAAYYALTLEMDGRGRRLVYVLSALAMTVAALAIGHLTGTGIGAILLLVSASVLPWVLPLGQGVFWLLLQNLGMLPVFLARPNFSTVDAVLQVGLYLSLATLTFITSFVAQRQTEAREALRLMNSELRAAQLLLAEGERASERLRISRELHDVVGHHLTALSLNLEVASHLVEGKAAQHVRQAQTVSKQLLADVRQVVSALRGSDAVDLDHALRELVAAVPAPQIHLTLPERFRLADPARAQVLVRLTQEILTNTMRHARARNLWIEFSVADHVVELVARDDGRGAEGISPGNGLTGMRERLEGYGGSLDIETRPGYGFVVLARLPLERIP